MKINFIEYWLDTVTKSPERTSVICGSDRFTVSQVDGYAQKLSNEVSSIVNGINKPICVFAPKSIISITSDIAILYSGNCYLNLDIRSPKDRILQIINTIQPALIIVDDTSRKLLSESEIHIPILFVSLQKIINMPTGPESKKYKDLVDTDPMCIINTSGSTGIPKGVVLNHKSFIDFYEWALDEFKFNNNQIIGSLSPSVFDIYSYELCLLMGNGATMVLIPEGLSAFPSEIINLIKLERVNFIFWVPTIMVNIANLRTLDNQELNDLKMIWFAGEVFPTLQFNYWRRKLKNTTFVNLYGPIEITLDCTYFIVDRDIDDDESIPIGRACRNTNLLVLDEMMQPVNLSNHEGELYVRGTSLAMGYYNNPEMTQQSFIQNPLNKHYPEIVYRTGDLVMWNEKSELVFKGRRDSMIKHLGYRIELSEIEHAAVNKAKIVQNAFVTYRPQDKTIVMAYESPEEIDIATLRSALSLYIPKYMLPNQFVHFKSFPMNTNGKIDRLSLARQLSIPASL
jgi:amino acid adenylation domain-containing protein